MFCCAVTSNEVYKGYLFRVPRSTFSFSAEKGGKVYCMKKCFEECCFRPILHLSSKNEREIRKKNFRTTNGLNLLFRTSIPRGLPPADLLLPLSSVPSRRCTSQQDKGLGHQVDQIQGLLYSVWYQHSDSLSLCLPSQFREIAFWSAHSLPPSHR